MLLSYSVVPKKKEDFDSCRVCRLFSGLAKKGYIAASFCVLTTVPQASGFSHADGLGDKSPFITTELHQLTVYGEQ
jgi:hypothetical protein